MKKPLMCVVGGSEVAIFCALALATACTGAIGTVQGNSGQAGGSPAGVAEPVPPAAVARRAPAGARRAAPGRAPRAQAPRAVRLEWPTWERSTRTLRRSRRHPGLLRRLTRNQFRNAVRDVFAYDVNVSDLDTDSFTANFASIGAATVVTSDRGVEQYSTAIENAVNAVFADATKRSQFIGCTPTGQSNDTCVRGFIQKLGLRAWRRPLETAELDRFVALAASASTTLGSATEGARWATVALFDVAELPLSPGDRSRRPRAARFDSAATRSPRALVPDLEQPSGPDADGSGDERDAGNGRRDPDRRDADAERVGGARIGGRLRRGVHAARSDRDPGEGSGAVPRIRDQPAGGHGPRHPRHLGVAGVRRSGELLRSVHDHEGRGERRSRPPLRHRCDRSDLDHLPDQVVAGRRHAQWRAEQGGPCCRSSRTSNRAPPRCAGSSSANR